MTQRYDYTIKELHNGYLVTASDNHKDESENRYFTNRSDAAEYVIKLLGELVDEQK